MSPPHGGFNPDDPNQQIVAEDIFDEYGGFLGETSIPDLLTKFSSRKAKKKSSKSKHRRRSMCENAELSDDHGSGLLLVMLNRRDQRRRDTRERSNSNWNQVHQKAQKIRRHPKRSRRHKSSHSSSSEASDSDEQRRAKHSRHLHWQRHRHRHQRHHHLRCHLGSSSH